MDNLTPFSLLALAGVESLEFDIYDEHEKIIAYRGQAIDPGFLLRLQFAKLYKKAEKLAEIDYFDNLLVSKTNKDRIINLLKNENGILLLASPEEQSKKLLLQAVIGYMSKKSSVLLIDNKLTSKYPVKLINDDNQSPKLLLNTIKSEISSNNNTIIFNINVNEELFELISENLASEELIIIVSSDSNSFNALSNINKVASDKMLLSLLLKGVIFQRTIPSLCSCKEEYYPENEELYSLFERSSISRLKFYNTGECNLCGSTGINGHIQLHEVLPINEEITKLIAKNSKIDQVKIKAFEEKFENIKYDAFKKAVCGLITLSEITGLQ